MLALSAIYAAFGEVPLIAGLFYGLKCAVLILVVEALLRVAKRALKGRVPWVVAGLAFAALFLLDLPFPMVVLAAGLAGYLAPAAFTGGGHGAAKDGPPALLDALLAAEPDRIARLTAAARRAGLLALVLWVWPVVMLLGTPVWGDIAWFFSKMAVVTFGGAYAVLAYVAQEAVEHYRWLRPGEMLDGLGMAETTPGPLIMVLQFVGFMAAYRDPGPLSPLLAGTLGGLLTTWVTFTPCFLWIFFGAPFVEALRENKPLNAALSAITAAVV